MYYSHMCSVLFIVSDRFSLVRFIALTVIISQKKNAINDVRMMW